MTTDEDPMVTWWNVEVLDRNYEAARDRLVPGLGAPQIYLRLRARTHELLGQRDLALHRPQLSPRQA